MASGSSDQPMSSDESDQETILYTPVLPPAPAQRRRRVQPVQQRRQQQQLQAITTLRQKKEWLREIIADLGEQQSKTILLATVEKSPDVLWDIFDCGQFDGQEPPEEPSNPDPSPSPSRNQSPSWCVCGRCEEMPTAEERVCCGKSPKYCLSTLPHFQMIALDETVLQVANLYRQDIFAYPEEADRNKGFRHAGYRQFTLWQHGRLGAGNRRVIPSCCVSAIRRKFPDPYGHYTGFIAGRLG